MGTVDFSTTQFSINPGCANTFPWLASQARAWETYKFHSLEFTYFTRTGSQTVGSLYLIPDYDAADPAPPTEQMASTYQDMVEDAPWKNIRCSLNRNAMMKTMERHYVRPDGALAANLDLKTYDVANLFVGTVDGVADTAWGTVWVDYDVELYTPQPPSDFGSLFLQSTVGESSANKLGTAPFKSGNLNASYDGANVLTLTGLVTTNTYFVTFYEAGTGLAVCTLTFSANVDEGIAYSLVDVGGSAGTRSACAYEFTATSGTVTITILGAATTVTDAAFSIVSFVAPPE